MITYFAVREEGGMYEEIPHAEWEALWLERPAGFCGLGIAFHWEDVNSEQFGHFRLPHGFMYDFVLRRVNQDKGTTYPEWRAVPPARCVRRD